MRSTLLTLAAVTAVTALTACGGGGDTTGTGDTGPTTTTAPSTPPATSAAATPPVALTGTVDDRGTKDIGSATTLAMDLGDFYFAPTYVTAAPGTKLTIALTNSGKAPHTFTVQSPNVDVSVEAGGTGTASLTLPSSGTLAFYCRFHRAQGMQGGFAVS
ncbi:MAG TPA: cupredoxin domain-containing protein [Frankiaceae bacterium]|nr:cupredoxin domain-containing protein [Frankiaceae bacterium]